MMKRLLYRPPRRPPPMRRPTRLPVAFALLALWGAALGCRSVPPRLGTTGPEAIVTADGVFGSIATRFSTVTRDPKARIARQRIARQALTPAALFNDTAAWLWSAGPDLRSISWRGTVEGRAMHFRAAGNLHMPARAGEGLHHLQLRRLGDGAYEWTANVDLGIGAATPANVAAIPAAFIAAGERADLAAARAEIATAFPRSAQTWGRLFSVQALRSEPDGSGAWRQRHTITLHTDRAARTYPRFGKWLAEYISPVRMHLRLRQDGRTWFDFTLRGDTMTLAFRSRNGTLLPLEGGDMPMPDTVRMETDFSTRLLIFRLGFRQLENDFITVRTAQRRGWLLRFTNEPQWDLPLLTERMLRSPLRRPFTGTGSTLSVIATARSDWPQAALARSLVVPVQDSPILRFLGRLGNAAVDGYVNGAEEQSTAWISAAFGALRDDARAVLTGD